MLRHQFRPTSINHRMLCNTWKVQWWYDMGTWQAKYTHQSCSRHKERSVTTAVQTIPSRIPGSNNAASRLVALLKLRTCCVYLFFPSTPRLPQPHQPLNPTTIWHTHRTRWPGSDSGAGASRQLALSGRASSSLWTKGWWMTGCRYPEPFCNNSRPQAAPHLSLPSTVPARRRSITVYRARPKRPVNYKTFFPRSERVRDVNVKTAAWSFSDPQDAFFQCSSVRLLGKSKILQLRTVLSLLSGRTASCLHLVKLQLWNQ